mgnify:CR=1 FL=1
MILFHENAQVKKFNELYQHVLKLNAKIESIKREFQLALNLNHMMNANKDFFGQESLYGNINKSQFKNMQELVRRKN